MSLLPVACVAMLTAIRNVSNIALSNFTRTRIHNSQSAKPEPYTWYLRIWYQVHSSIINRKHHRIPSMSPF